MTPAEKRKLTKRRDTAMESMGYGDEQCPECGHTEYAESEEDFNARIGRKQNDENG